MNMTTRGEVMLREIAEIPRVLSDIASHMRTESAASSLFDLKKFSSVVILARGTSDNAGHFLKYLIETKMGLPCALASPSAATMYPTNFHYKETLVVAISQSGRSEDLLAFARAAKDGGGYLLSITNDKESPLAKLSDIHIPVLAGPELAVPATKSYVGQLMISYLLTMQWAKQTYEVNEVISGAAEILAQEEKIAEFASKIDINKPLYVLGRGFSYPNAKEFALKLQETSLIPVQGMSSSDFLHGPIASLHESSQVVFMAPHHLPAESFGETPDRVRAITNQVFWIGQGPTNSATDVVLNTPRASSEVTGSIVDAIAFQKLTQKIALNNGLDPDSPRGLSKVTITR
jgi:glutamine---fructose-6-phosphate transaminase (isomerizing)